MRVLVACEESQEVCKAFRARGHEAYSCDIQECSGGHPEWHIKGDVLEILNPKFYPATDDDTLGEYGIGFFTDDEFYHFIPSRWDMIIAHPPCTDLASSGAQWFPQKQKDGSQQKSIDFFMAFVNADCPKIVIENPIGIMSTKYRKPDQIISPWQFALEDWENTEKRTCLWIIGDLSPLIPKNKIKPDFSYHEFITKKGVKKRQSSWYYQTRCLPYKERGRAASKTFPGIAKAMSEQWG